MSTPAEVLTALKAQISGYAGLSALEGRVYLGAREDLPAFPVVVIEPVSMSETEERYPTQTMRMTVAVTGAIKTTDADKQIVGDATITGILDLENDLKLAIDSDRTLGGVVIHTAVTSSLYDTPDFPIRAVTLTVEILFEQLRGTRA